MRTENTSRLSDKIPLGVECALPQMPSPASRASAQTRIWRKLVLAVAAIFRKA